MSTIKLSTYKKFYIWFGKKISLLVARRDKNDGYKALETGVLTMILDGLMLFGAVSYLLSPSTLTLLLSFSCGSFMIKKIFPSVIQLISSINLIKVGK